MTCRHGRPIVSLRVSAKGTSMLSLRSQSAASFMSNHAFQRLRKQFLIIEASETYFRQLHKANLFDKGAPQKRPTAASGATVGWQATDGLQGEALAARL